MRSEFLPAKMKQLTNLFAAHGKGLYAAFLPVPSTPPCGRDCENLKYTNLHSENEYILRFSYSKIDPNTEAGPLR